MTAFELPSEWSAVSDGGEDQGAEADHRSWGALKKAKNRHVSFG